LFEDCNEQYVVPHNDYSLLDSRFDSDANGRFTISLVITRSRPKWFGQTEHRDDADWVKQCTGTLTDTERTRQMRYTRETCWDYVRILELP